MKLKLQEPYPVASQIYWSPFAIILTGGGAKGRWQAGVLAALCQHNIFRFASLVAGTSVGGLNAALFSLSESIPDPNENTPSFRQAVEVWESIKKNSQVYKGTLNDGFFDKAKVAWKVLTGAPSILDPSPLHNLIDRTFGDITLEELSNIKDFELAISSVDLNRQSAEFYTSYGSCKTLKVAELLKRTSAIPAVFKSIPGKDPKDQDKFTHWHVDGGVGANNPFSTIFDYNKKFPEYSIKKVIIIYCSPDETHRSDKKYNNIISTLVRTASSILEVQEEMVEKEIEFLVNEGILDVYELWPPYETYDSLDFTHTDLLQKGYDYAIQHIHKIEQFLTDNSSTPQPLSEVVHG